jgi:hypothetical protein
VRIKKIFLLSSIIVVFLGALSASKAFAQTWSQDECEAQGGSWEITGDETATCTWPAGSETAYHHCGDPSFTYVVSYNFFYDQILGTDCTGGPPAPTYTQEDCLNEGGVWDPTGGGDNIASCTFEPFSVGAELYCGEVPSGALILVDVATGQITDFTPECTGAQLSDFEIYCKEIGGRWGISDGDPEVGICTLHPGAPHVAIECGSRKYKLVLAFQPNGLSGGAACLFPPGRN